MSEAKSFNSLKWVNLVVLPKPTVMEINHDQKPIYFTEDGKDVGYRVPIVTRKCETCFSWHSWVYVDHDWNSDESGEKWITFKCLGSQYIHEYRSETPCDNRITLPLSESLRIKEGES